MAVNPISIPPIAAAIAGDVLRGLTSTPKSLPPWLFYDDRGSALFEEITRLPEYYLTRTERAIFREHGGDIIRAAGAGPLTIVELGAGSAEKTGLLIDQALRQKLQLVYEPVDVSKAALDAAAVRLRRQWPALRVKPLVGDYTNGFRLNGNGTRRLVLWIGSSIGNFEHHEAERILHNVRRQLRPGDALLLGADLAPSRTKPAKKIIAAYDDACGVTSQFNRNILARLNHELGADFDLAAFRHIAEWNGSASRMQMYLESTVAQQVRIEALDLTLKFARGERIHTENSYKYRPAHLDRIITSAGFTPTEKWNDDRNWFSVVLARIA